MDTRTAYPAKVLNPPAWLLRLFLGMFFFALVSGCLILAIGQTNTNPHADFWRAVRNGVPGYTAVDSGAHAILIQNGGQNWRQIRNGPLASISPWILAAALAVIGLLYLVAGKDRLEKGPTGEKIVRYSLRERILHWFTAVLFIVMTVTGLSMLFGRGVLIPLFGHSPFAGFMQWGMWVHNVSGPFFLAGVLLEVIVWFTDNIPRKMDIAWFKNLGGMVGKGPRPHAGKINGGEKAWFWLLFVLAPLIGSTGLILDFPMIGQNRALIQVSHVIHSASAVLLIAVSFGHMYIGTIGAEGTFEGMWSGKVEAAWAKQHQDLWYEEQIKKQIV